MLAPTGTIAFMMDCDTTGVEPDIALVKYKKLVGGGMLKIVNTTVPRALRRLGYESREIQDIVEYIDEHDTIEGAPHLKDEHLPVFDCAFKPARGQRSIHYLGHLRMMGAVQPFISGAISKTINMPNEATVEDIMEAYVDGVAARREGGRDLSRRLQADAAAQHGAGREGRGGAGGRGAAGAPPPAAGLPLGAPQVRYRRPRGLHPRRLLRGRHARARSSSRSPRRAARSPA